MDTFFISNEIDQSANVKIVQLSSLDGQRVQVITLQPPTSEPHPLEVEVQRSREQERMRQITLDNDIPVTVNRLPVRGSPSVGHMPMSSVPVNVISYHDIRSVVSTVPKPEPQPADSNERFISLQPPEIPPESMTTGNDRFVPLQMAENYPNRFTTPSSQFVSLQPSEHVPISLASDDNRFVSLQPAENVQSCSTLRNHRFISLQPSENGSSSSPISNRFISLEPAVPKCSVGNRFDSSQNENLPASLVNEDFHEPTGLSTSEIPVTVGTCGKSAIDGDLATVEKLSRKDEPESDYKGNPTDKEQGKFEDDKSTMLPDRTNSTNRFFCYLCSTPFIFKKNLYAHIRKIHSEQPMEVGCIICPLCGMNFMRQLHLRTHFWTLHELKIEEESKRFKTAEDFEIWKNDVESKTGSCFVARCAATALAGNESKRYYKCQRSGTSFIPLPIMPYNQRKTKLVSKIGATCPASMETTEDANGLTVTYWATHVGHNVPEPVYPEPKKKKKKKDTDTMSTTNVDLLNEIIHEPTAQPDPLVPRKPKRPERSRPTQEMLIVQAEMLLSLLEKGQVAPESRRHVSKMLTNVCSAVQRRTVLHNKPNLSR